MFEHAFVFDGLRPMAHDNQSMNASLSRGGLCSVATHLSVDHFYTWCAHVYVLRVLSCVLDALLYTNTSDFSLYVGAVRLSSFFRAAQAHMLFSPSPRFADTCRIQSVPATPMTS